MPSSPTSSRKEKSSPSHSRRSTPAAKSSSRTKGVPQNFGYIKRSNGTATANEIQTNTVLLAGGRTAHVSAVPRTNKIKVSGGTQTATADFQPSKNFLIRRFLKFSLNPELSYFRKSATASPISQFFFNGRWCSAIKSIGERKVRIWDT